MRPDARLLIYSVIAAGSGILLWAMAHWRSEDPVRFAVYVALAIIAAKMKIYFRKPDVSLSVGFVVAYVALFNLHLSEAVAFGCLAVIGPQFFRGLKSDGLPQRTARKKVKRHRCPD